jgi:ERF superfamily
MESIELLRILAALLDEIKSLSAKIDAIKISKTVISEPHRSPELHELFSAMAKAQAEMKIAGQDSENPFFKNFYADLASLVRASRPSLTKFGLSVLQQVLPNDDGQMILHTILGHSSGQYIESRMRILPVKNDIQSFGSYITYLRRYSYAAIIGCVASGEDDDGEVSMVGSRETMAKGVALNSKYHPKSESHDTITKEQIDELEYELGEYPDILDQVLDGLKIQSLADMPKTKFRASADRIRQIKNMRNGIK